MRRSARGPGLCGFLGWFGAACVLAPIAVQVGGPLAALLTWAALGGVILPLSAFGVVVNRRRIVKYPSGLAWLARYLPPLRRLERRLRRAYELAEVEEVRADRDLVLRLRGGVTHRLYMNSPAAEVEALAATIRSLVAARAAEAGPAGEVPPVEAPPVADVPLAVHGERAVAVRCAYCHDDLEEGVDLATGCEACRTPHHAECLEIHGGCAVRGCARGRPRVRAPR